MLKNLISYYRSYYQANYHAISLSSERAILKFLENKGA